LGIFHFNVIAAKIAAIMKGLEFSVIGTKVKGLKRSFDLASPQGRKEYFEAKAGDEIVHLTKYFEKNTFIAYFLGKKNAGKGTYSKLFTEIFGEEKIAHISVGDLVREYHANWENFSKSEKFSELKKLYRGFISFEEAVNSFLGRNTKTLLPTEFILALLKLHINELEGRTIFIDGLPRQMDQVSYSLYFRDLINYRNDPDMFILLDLPEAVIAERIKSRVICPKCNTSRSIKFLITSKVGYDEKQKEFYLMCDNPSCEGARMVPKEGDELGIEPIRGRLEKDEELLKTVFGLYGVPKVLLRNHVPVSDALKYYDTYEITPEYVLSWNKSEEKVSIKEKPWTVLDDNGIEVYSLLAPPVMVTMLKQLVDILQFEV
jgi:adenylate kinase family enzyme